MAKTETVKIRMAPALKAEGEGILSALGLSTTEAVTLFFRQIVMRRGLPFEAKIPNDEILEAFREARETPARLLRYPDGKTAVAEMLKDLASRDETALFHQPVQKRCAAAGQAGQNPCQAF